MDLRLTRASLPSTERDDMLVRRAGRMQVDQRSLARGEMRSESDKKIDSSPSQPHSGLVIRRWKEGRESGRQRARKRQEPVGSRNEWCRPAWERGGTGSEGKLATTTTVERTEERDGRRATHGRSRRSARMEGERGGRWLRAFRSIFLSRHFAVRCAKERAKVRRYSTVLHCIIIIIQPLALERHSVPAPRTQQGPPPPAGRTYCTIPVQKPRTYCTTDARPGMSSLARPWPLTLAPPTGWFVFWPPPHSPCPCPSHPLPFPPVLLPPRRRRLRLLLLAERSRVAGCGPWVQQGGRCNNGAGARRHWPVNAPTSHRGLGAGRLMM
jgi:hypothetical protein